MEERIQRIENQLKALQAAFIQSQKNQTPITTKTDDTANKVVEITPWTASKTVYIEDTECVFDNVPSGNLTVYLDKPYTVERMTDRVIVRFEALDEVKEVTLSIL